MAAKLACLLSATLCLLAIARAAVDLSDTLADTDRAINSIALDVHVLSTAAHGKLNAIDPLLAKAGQNLDSLDRAIRTHEAATRRASDELHGTFQNANAILLQAGLTSDEVRRASIEQRAGLGASNAKLNAALDELRGLVADARKELPPIHEGIVATANSAKQIDAAIYELRHPPKQTKGQRALRFLLQIVLGNGIQGAVRR